jgi:hypothetical protein
VHDHEFIQCHVLSFKTLKIGSVEDFFKSDHNNINLNVVKSVSRKLVFMFEIC